MSTWWVSQSGAGLGDGSSSTNPIALASITWGGGGIVAGDTVVFMGTFTSMIDINGDGAEGSPIYVAGESCIVEGAGSLTSCMQIVSNNYIHVLGGIELRDALTNGLLVGGTSTGLIIDNVIADGSGNQAFQHEGSARAVYNDIVGRNCVDDGFSIHHASSPFAVVNRGEFYGNDEGIAWAGTSPGSVFIGQFNDCNIHDNTTFSTTGNTDGVYEFIGGTITGPIYMIGGTKAVFNQLKHYHAGGISRVENTGQYEFHGVEAFGDGVNHMYDNFSSVAQKFHGCLFHNYGAATDKYCILNRTTSQDIDIKFCVFSGEGTNARGYYKAVIGATETIENSHFLNLELAVIANAGSITTDYCNFSGNDADTSGTVTNNNSSTITPDFANLAGGDLSVPSTSSLVGAGSKTWAGPNPVGLDGEPFQSISPDLNAVQSKYNAFHPSRL